MIREVSQYEMVSFEAALEAVLAAAAPLEALHVPLPDSLGAFLARDARSLLDVPSHPASQMDGYALVSTSLTAASRSSKVAASRLLRRARPA